MQQECPGFEDHEAWGSLFVIVSARLGQPPRDIRRRDDSMALPQITPDDAMLVFKKWLSEKTEVACVGRFRGCLFNLLGKVVAAESEGVVFRSTDPRTFFAIRLDVEDFVFWYAEPKDFPVDVPEYAKRSGTICVALPLRLTLPEFESDLVPTRDKVFFTEMVR